MSMSDMGLNVTPSAAFSVGRSHNTHDGDQAIVRSTPLHRKLIVISSLIAGDLLTAIAAVQVVAFLGQLANATTPVLAATQYSVPFVVIVFFCMGLYSGNGPSPVERFRLRIIGIIIVVGNIVVASLPPGLPIGSLLIALCLGALLAVFGFYTEFIIRRILIRKRLWGAATVIFGLNSKSRQFYSTLLQHPELGLHPIGFVSTPADETGGDAAVPGRILGNLGEFEKFSHSIEVAIFSSTQDLAEANASHGTLPIAQVVLVDDKAQIQNLRLRPRALDQVIGLEVKRDLLLSQNRMLKRAVDLAIATPLAILTMPIIAVLALAIRAIDPGRAIYVQTRVGLHGKSVKVFKLRSMYADAEVRLQQHLQANPAARAEWAKYFKLSNDPRILPVLGAFIRRSSIDELPQLWNVLRGDMSLVGPRPFPAYHSESFGENFQVMRTSIPPGITGLWQVSSRSDGDLTVQEAQDQYYIRNWSVWLDLYILFQTLPAVLEAKGAK